MPGIQVREVEVVSAAAGDEEDPPAGEPQRIMPHKPKSEGLRAVMAASSPSRAFEVVAAGEDTINRKQFQKVTAAFNRQATSATEKIQRHKRQKHFLGTAGLVNFIIIFFVVDAKVRTETLDGSLVDTKKGQPVAT